MNLAESLLEVLTLSIFSEGIGSPEIPATDARQFECKRTLMCFCLYGKATPLIPLWSELVSYGCQSRLTGCQDVKNKIFCDIRKKSPWKLVCTSLHLSLKAVVSFFNPLFIYLKTKSPTPWRLFTLWQRRRMLMGFYEVSILFVSCCSI